MFLYVEVLYSWTSIIRTIRLCGFFPLVPIFSWILISCDLQNSKSQKAQSSFQKIVETAYYTVRFSKFESATRHDAFWCVQLISDWLNCFVVEGISCLINPIRVGYVNTRAIDCKLKSKTCLRSESEPFYRCKISRYFFHIFISLIFIFSIIWTLDYPDYLLRSRRVRITEVRL